MKNDIAILLFHQGWTDIFNSLPLIDYYAPKYKNIYLLIRKDSKDIVDFYIRKKSNIQPIYVDINLLNNVNPIKYLAQLDLFNYDILFHGNYDVYRTTKYVGQFYKNRNLYFVKSFYVPYGIDYLNRINLFIFERDYNMENKKYLEFTKIYGEKYILYHGIDKPKYNNINIASLDNITKIFFDYIKILENSIEMHLLDSVWGAFVYLLGCKYKLFTNKKIYIYCKRNHNEMFSDPMKLENFVLL